MHPLPIQFTDAELCQVLLVDASWHDRRKGIRDGVGGDLLYGADAIAQFLFDDRNYRRRVYNLVERNGAPVFRIGIPGATN